MSSSRARRGRIGRSAWLVAYFLLAASLPASADDSKESVSPSWTGNSAQDLYTVTIRPEADTIPIGKMHRWIVTLLDAEGEPVYPAWFSVGGGMRGHGHGLPTQPQVIAYGGNGDYLLDGMRFNMEGAWTLSLMIESDVGSDRVDFELDISF